MSPPQITNATVIRAKRNSPTLQTNISMRSGQQRRRVASKLGLQSGNADLSSDLSMVDKLKMKRGGPKNAQGEFVLQAQDSICLNDQIMQARA